MEYLIKPWKHQEIAIDRAKDLQGYGLFFEMGAGKTSTAINILRAQYGKHGRVLRTLIFGPPIVLHNWKREFGIHSKIPPSQVIVLHGSGKSRVRLFEAFKDHGDHVSGRIFITNYESLSMDDLFDLFEKWKPEAIIFDECHKLKDRRSKRSKLADKLANPGTKAKPAPRPLVYCLTGSPILNDAMDIFHQFKLLDGGEAFGKSFMEFRARYFRDKNAGMDRQKYFPNWVPIAGSMEEISKRMDKSSMRVLKKDCLDLPPLVRKVVTIEMNGEQRKAYKEMLNEFITFFESQGEQHTAMATLAITKGLRLMQLASGYVRTVDGQEVPLAEGFSPKQEALKELLEDLICGNQKNKVLIWAVWRQNYSQIRAVLDKLKIKFVEVHGDVDDKKKFANVDAFTSDPEVRVLLGHPASAGCGINLIAASYCIFFSRNFSLENDIQAEARNYRGGSEIHEKVTRIDLVTKDSIEEEIVNALSRKEAIGVEVLKQITVKAERS